MKQRSRKTHARSRGGRPATIVGARRRSYDLGTAHDETLEAWRKRRGLQYTSEALRDILEWVARRPSSWPAPR